MVSEFSSEKRKYLGLSCSIQKLGNLFCDVFSVTFVSVVCGADFLGGGSAGGVPL